MKASWVLQPLSLLELRKTKQGFRIEVGASQSVEVDADPKVVAFNVTNIKFDIIKFISLSSEVSLVMWLINVDEIVSLQLMISI